MAWSSFLGWWDRQVPAGVGVPGVVRHGPRLLLLVGPRSSPAPGDRCLRAASDLEQAQRQRYQADQELSAHLNGMTYP